MSYFRVNYAIATVGTTSLVLFMNPLSLVVLAFLALMWAYFYILKSGPVVLGGRELRCGRRGAGRAADDVYKERAAHRRAGGAGVLYSSVEDGEALVG